MKKSKSYSIVLGMILIVLGIICICNPNATLLTMSWIIGFTTLLTGSISIVRWIQWHNMMPQSSLILLSGILQILIGVTFLNHDYALAALLPVVFAFWLLWEGIKMVFRSSDAKKLGFSKWWVILIAGTCVVIAGYKILGQPINLGGSVISLLVGISLIFLGTVYLLAVLGDRVFKSRIQSRFGSGENSIDEQ